MLRALILQNSLEITNLSLKFLRLTGDLNDTLLVYPKCLQAGVTTSPFPIFQDKKWPFCFLTDPGGGKLHLQERQEAALFLSVLRRHHGSKSDNRY